MRDDAMGLERELIRDVLGEDTVRTLGDPIVAVAVETRDQARAAAAAVRVEYERLPVMMTPEEALAPGAIQIHKHSPNLCYSQTVVKGDAHKWLNVPYDSELAFVRDGEALRAAMAVSAEYLPIGMAHRNPSDYTPELSRRARAHLPVCKTVCSGPQGSRLRSAKLSRAQSGTSLVRRCGRYKEDYRRAAS
jgi:CO/xanthine dehydrogenase Mo-binding subunit